MKKIILKFWPIIFLVLLWFSFVAPYFVKNKTPFPTTYLVNFFAPWNAYENFWQPVKNDAMPDIIGQIYPWRVFAVDSLKNGEIPLWNPYSFSGTPHLANYQSAVFSPFNLLFFIFSNIDAWTILVLLQPLLAGLFTYLFARSLKIINIGSLIAAISFMFSGFMTTWMGYATLGYAILFLPLALFAIQKVFETKKFLFFILLSLTIPLSFFSGHFQTSLYFLIFLSIFVIFKFLETRDRKQTILSFIFIFLGLLISSPQLFPSIEFYLNAPRSGIFQKLEAIPLSHLATIFAPDFFGNPVTRNNPIGHYSEWSSYVGIIPLFFAVYVMLRSKRKLVIFFLLTGIGSLLLAFDTPLLDLLFKLRIPVISTSAASRIIVVFSFSIAILAAFGIEKLLEDLKERKRKYFLITSIALLIIFAILLLYSKTLNTVYSGIAIRNSILPLIFLCTGIISFSLYSFNKKFLTISIIAVIFLISFDMYRFTTKWQPMDPKNLIFPDVPIMNTLKDIRSEYRVFGNVGTGEFSVYYRLPSVEGYDPLYIERYGELLSTLQKGEILPPARSGVDFDNRGVYSKKAVDLLGIKYIFYKGGDKGKIWGFPFSSYPKEKFVQIFKDSKYRIYENTSVYPRAFFVKSFVIEKNDQKIINRMFAPNFDLRESAVLEENPGIKNNSSGGSVEIINYQNNKVEITTQSERVNLLVLTDVYYPGWIAKIDGNLTKIYRTDFAFRGIEVPEGTHKVEFIYDPLSFRLGILGAFLGTLGIIILILLNKKHLIYSKN